MRTGALAQLTGEAPGLPEGAASGWLSDCARADPPELSGSLYDLKLRHRPELRHLAVDERYARALRARLRSDLELTAENSSSTDWYGQPRDHGYSRVPEVFTTPPGRDVVREWFDDERERLCVGRP